MAALNLTLPGITLDTFSVEQLRRLVAPTLPSGASVVVQVQDIQVHATGMLAMSSSAFTPTIADAFATALAVSLGVTASQLTLQVAQPISRRRLLSQLAVPFTVSSLGADPAVASAVITRVTAATAPSSSLSAALQSLGVGAMAVPQTPTASVVASLQYLASTGDLAAAAAAALAAVLPAGAQMTTPVVTGAGPASPPAVIPLEAGTDPSAAPALYAAALAAQCERITTPGIMDVAAAAMGASVACVHPAPAATAALQPPSLVRQSDCARASHLRAANWRTRVECAGALLSTG